MKNILEFEKYHEYNMLEVGITVPAILSTGFNSVEVGSKVDTGASFCIFERKVAKELFIEVESGERLNFSTATGTFVAFGHELTISVLKSSLNQRFILRRTKDLRATFWADAAGSIW